MARKQGQNWEPAIPLRAAEIYLLGIERWIASLPDECKTGREYQVAKSRTHFLRGLIDDIAWRSVGHPAAQVEGGKR